MTQNIPLFAKPQFSTGFPPYCHLFLNIALSPLVKLIKDICSVPERHVFTSIRHASIASSSVKPYQILTRLPRTPKCFPFPNLPTTSHIPQSSIPPLTSRSHIQSHLFMHQPECLAADWGKGLRAGAHLSWKKDRVIGVQHGPLQDMDFFFFEVLPVWRHLSHAVRLSASTKASGSNPSNILVALWYALHSLEEFHFNRRALPGRSSADTLSCNQFVQAQLEKERCKRRKALTLEVDLA